jgi:hypothetical protein
MTHLQGFSMPLWALALISHYLTKLELRAVIVQSRTLGFLGCPALVDLRMED